MNLIVLPVSALSEAERQQLQIDLVWMNEISGADWDDHHWCVTLENSSLRLSLLVEAVDDSIFDDAGALVAN